MRPDTLARAKGALRDPSRTRIVARMQLKLPAHEDEAPARRTLEDALNSAEFDDCGRLVVVRSLVLPRFPIWASSAWVTRAIETAWRAQAAYAVHAVHASSGEASSARAVFFRDITEARVLLMQALTGVGNVDVWFWPLAVPEFVPGAARNDTIVRVLTALVCDAGARERPGLAALGAQMTRWGVTQLRTLLDALPRQPPSAFAEYASRAASIRQPAQTTSEDRDHSLSVKTVEHTSRIERHDAVRRLALVFASNAGVIDVDGWRNVLLSEALMLGGALSSAAPAAQDVRAVLRATASLAARDRGADLAIQEENPQPWTRAENTNLHPQPSASSARLEGESFALLDAGPPPIARAGVQSEQTTAHSAASSRVPHLPWLEGTTATSFGGLLLVLNVFDRLGIDGWLALQPIAGRNVFVTVLLAEVARRLRIRSDDPHWQLFASASDLLDAMRGSRWQWQGFDWPAWSRLDRVAEESMEFERSVSNWLRALRKVLRRRCRIGLATLVRRHAWVSVSSTHVDLVFALNAIDLRVRRAGLDADPGWLPWFGRIVALHFIDARSGGMPDA